MLVAVALDDIYKEGYMPYDAPSVKTALTKRLQNSKKGDAFIKQIQGKGNSVESYAAVMGTQVDTIDVVFSMNLTHKLGQEPAIIGRMSSAKPGVLQGPWKGESAVFVYQVIKQEKAERKSTKEELDERYARNRGAQIYAQPGSINQILTNATKVKRNLIEFY